MYAVIETGGKQYRVELGSELQVDRIDAQPGDSITLERVLLVADGDATAVGRPVVDGATVRAEVLAQDRGEKVVVFKYKPKARTRVKAGFRAELTRLRVADIAFAGRSASADARASETQRSRAAREAEKAAAEKAAADQELAARLAAMEPPAEASAAAADDAAAAPAEGAVVDPSDARGTGTRTRPTRKTTTTGLPQAEGDAGADASSPGGADDASSPGGAEPDTRKDE
jgi:large subunit ribosomal protein L21